MENIEFEINQLIWDAIFPVGSIRKFTNDIDPNKLYGGTWIKMEGVFLLASDENHPLGSTGGKEFLELTANIGACNNNPTVLGYTGTPGPSKYARENFLGGPTYIVTGTGTIGFSNWNHGTTVTEHNENSRFVDNKPPYRVVNVWERIA